MKLNNRKCIITCLYRSPSQTSEQFLLFLQKFENLLQIIQNESPYLQICLGDLNARNETWWSDDTTNKCGIEINNVTSSFNLNQIINEPTHILKNSLSCIDLIFSSQPNLVLRRGVLPSLHENCHHQIIHASFNLRVHYPPPYERVLWDYKKANLELIQRSIKEFDWHKSLTNLHPDDQVEVLNNTLLNIMKNFIPNKKSTFNDKDIPWITEEIKKVTKAKNKII